MRRNRPDAAPEGSAGRPAGETAPAREPTAAQVANFLRRNPNFLAEQPDLLTELMPPARVQGDGVVDLQQVMVERLREKVESMTKARDALVHAGRSNMAAQSRVHTAILALLGARSFEHLIETCTTDLAVILNLDAVTLGVERQTSDVPPLRLGGLCQLEPDTVDSLIGRGRKLILHGDIEGSPAVFGKAAGLVASQALIRLEISPQTPPALLALGSRRADQFHPGQGTELLAFLAAALEQCIRAWLNIPG